jgi:hypothetical protein
MSLNLYDILQEVLLENVTPSEINDAINNKIQVIINYSDEEKHAPKKRLIEPYAYGMTKSGNTVLRAYQYNGDTFRGIPKWKLFRVDRITNWLPTNNHFNAQPSERGWNAANYNETNDNSMVNVLNQVHFDYDDNSTNPYAKGSKAYQIRKQTDNLKQSQPININQLQNNTSGPIVNQNIQNLNQKQNDDFQQMLKKNLEITQKEKDKRGFSLSSKNPIHRGPMPYKTSEDNDNENINIDNNGNK